jgi:hypothetical protein
VKGRDWYDLTWFVGKEVAVSLTHLRARLVQTGHLDHQDTLSIHDARELLNKRIHSLDIEAARKDVRPFLKLKDTGQLDVWSKDFFLDLAARVKFV